MTVAPAGNAQLSPFQVERPRRPDHPPLELRQAWNALRPGGLAIADDIDLNCGFHKFRAEHQEDPSLICPAEPLEPDIGRQGDRGVFAIVAKIPPAATR